MLIFKFPWPKGSESLQTCSTGVPVTYMRGHFGIWCILRHLWATVMSFQCIIFRYTHTNTSASQGVSTIWTDAQLSPPSFHPSITNLTVWCFAMRVDLPGGALTKSLGGLLAAVPSIPGSPKDWLLSRLFSPSSECVQSGRFVWTTRAYHYHRIKDHPTRVLRLKWIIYSTGEGSTGIEAFEKSRNAVEWKLYVASSCFYLSIFGKRGVWEREGGERRERQRDSERKRDRETEREVFLKNRDALTCQYTLTPSQTVNHS